MPATGGDKDEGQCGTCGGQKTKQVAYTDAKGETWRTTVPCPDCNGTGKKKT